jgi:hypothetical protein
MNPLATTSARLFCWCRAPRKRDANAHGSAGSGDLVACRRALLSLVLNDGSTRSDLPTPPVAAVSLRGRLLASALTKDQI